MNITCPCCFASSPLEAFAMTEAHGELLKAMAAVHPLCFRPMLAYLGLFRSGSRPLGPERGRKLVAELSSLDAEPQTLAAALTDTVESLRAKRVAGDLRPLKNHNYLKSVLISVGANNHSPASDLVERAKNLSPLHPATGKRRQALNLLTAWGEGSLLRTAIAAGLSGLVAIGRPGTPAAEMVCANADMWLHLLLKHSCCDSELDADRVTRAFSALVQKSMKEWPEPAALLPHLPARPYQPALPVAPLSEADREASVARFSAFKETL